MLQHLQSITQGCEREFPEDFPYYARKQHTMFRHNEEAIFYDNEFDADENSLKRRKER